MRNAVLICAMTLFLCGSSGVAMSEIVEVFPGAGTPFQDAIDAAAPGDTLHLNAGTYAEAVAVTKPLTIRGDVGSYLSGGPGAVVIEGGCSALSAVSVEADGVRLRGLRVFGGFFFAINVDSRSHVSVHATLSGATCEGVEYGINVFNSTEVKITKNWAEGFEDAGIYIGGVPALAKVRASRNVAVGNHRGFIVEDSGLSSVRLKSNEITGNEDGIFLHNSDGITIVRNTVADNEDVGIEIDLTSDQNVMIDNIILGSTTDVLDNGRFNCWRENTYATGSVPACE